MSTYQLEEANRRWAMLNTALPLLQSGLSQAHTAAALGISGASFSRLLNLAPVSHVEQRSVFNAAEKCRRLLAAGLEAVAPGVAEGRSSDFEGIIQLPEVRRRLLRLYVATFGAATDSATRDRRTGSVATACARLADWPIIPPLLAQKLRAGAKPRPFVKYLARFTSELEAKYRGGSHYTLAGVNGRRSLTVELADGSREDIRPGTWVFDDMSTNLPFWFEVPAGVMMPEDSRKARGLARMVERFGCGLGRQGLYAWDWASSAWLGFELLGRVRDAYTKDIILRFIHKLIRQYGKPDRIIFERSVWESNVISGWDMRDGQLVEIAEADERPGMGDETCNLLQSGLKALGIEIIYTHTPRGKPIEGAFNHHQRILPTFLEDDEAVNIGRHAGEFDWAARQHRRASAGSLHPRDLGFIHIARHADVSWEAMTWESGRPKKSRGGKSPTDILLAGLAELPAHRRMLTPEEDARFLPEVRPLPNRDPLKIRGGHITVSIDGEPHQFIHPEEFAALGDGYRVRVAFDPAEPAAGMAIYNAETADGLNHRGYAMGQYICRAEYHAAGPVISYRDRSEGAGVELIKAYKRFHRTEYRALDLARRAPAKIAQIRDGRGNTAEVQNFTAETPRRGEAEMTSAFSPQPSALSSSASPRLRGSTSRPCLGVTEETFDHQATRLSRLETATRRDALAPVDLSD